MGVVLVAGATGGVGKQVVQQMVERSYQVRALSEMPIRHRRYGDDVIGLVQRHHKAKFQSLKGFVSTPASLLRK